MTRCLVLCDTGICLSDWAEIETFGKANPSTKKCWEISHIGDLSGLNGTIIADPRAPISCFYNGMKTSFWVCGGGGGDDGDLKIENQLTQTFEQ